MLSISTILLSLLTFIISFVLYKILLRPYLDILYYRKQGGIGLFHWQLLSYFKHFKNARERNDFYYIYKEAFRAQPDAKFLVENFGPKPLLAVMDPEMIKQILQRYEIYQRDKDAVQLFLDLTRGTVIFKEEEAWKRSRKMISSAFNFEFIKDMIPVMVDVAEEQFEKWVSANNLNKVHLFDKLASITGEVTGRIFFGKRFSEKSYEGKSLTTVAIGLSYDIFNEAFDIFSVIFGSSFPRTNILPRHRRLNKTIRDTRNICKDMIREIEQGEARKENNLLNRLLDLRQQGGEDNSSTDEQIVGEFVGLFGAGTDTTANFTTSSIYYLCKYPKCYEKVKAEVEREFKDPRNITVEALNSMDYTAAFIKEVMRLAIGCLFYRVAVKDDNLAGIKIKKGTVVNVFLNVLQTSDKYFSRPDEFLPERWLADTELSQDPFKLQPYVYLPFSAGPRNCLGQHMAVIEMKLLIGLLIKKFTFKIPEDYKLNLVQGLVFEPLDPMLVDLKLRDR